MCEKLVLSVALVVFGVVALPGALQAQVENLVLNPSFEEDEVILDDPAWEQWCTWGYEDGVNSTVGFDETEAADGLRSLKVNPVGPTDWYFIVLYSPIPMEVGKEYTASFWVKAEEPRPFAAKFKATDNSVEWGQTPFELTSEWAEYYMTSEAQNATVKMEIFCAGSDVPLWLDFVNVYEGQYVPGIGPSGASPLAYGPTPKDGSVIDQTSAELQWRPGALADSHRVYLGESRDEVEQGLVEAISTTETSLDTGDVPAYAGGLTPGQTYYWRVDEVNDVEADSPWPGSVWSFRVRPLTAWNPSPADGVQYVRLDEQLAFERGLYVVFHRIYFGTTAEEVMNADPLQAWMTTDLFYAPPDLLEPNQTYYWRVDEFAGPTTIHEGDLWSFTTVPEVEVGDPALIGWWTLDEGEGTTAVDWSGHGNHGALVDSPQWTYGVQGGALYLSDGAHVAMPAPNVETNTATMTAWVKRDGDQSDWAAVLFSREGSGVSGMGFGPDNELHC